MPQLKHTFVTQPQNSDSQPDNDRLTSNFHPLCITWETNQKSRLIKKRKKMTVTHSKESSEYLNHRHTKN